MVVTQLYRYPVKSMLGEPLERCRVVDERGLAGDRAYALIDVETGTVASAKVPRLWGGLLGFSARCAQEPDGAGPPPVEITFPDGSVHHSGDADIDAALSTAIGRAVRLTAIPPEGAAFEEVWPEIDGLAPEAVVAGTRVRTEVTGEAVSRFDLAALAPHPAFFDLAVLHLLTTATLRRLRELAPAATFDARRYRPNLVVDTGDTGFVENGWQGRTLVFGSGPDAGPDVGPNITVSMPTMRCVMTTLAQDDLPRDPDTLRTIARHNRVDIPGLGTWACAGAYADVSAGGEIAVGDRFEVTDGR
ncbi:MOSC domain-containing protein [Pseudonocardia zijingensis]|uniref:MOSC domain-containing protein n=1 Tax=Pseudonocardia zijingensis TaxID=153376 RepID=A0ABN1N6H3_9PSEU